MFSVHGYKKSSFSLSSTRMNICSCSVLFCRFFLFLRIAANVFFIQKYSRCQHWLLVLRLRVATSKYCMWWAPVAVDSPWWFFKMYFTIRKKPTFNNLHTHTQKKYHNETKTNPANINCPGICEKFVGLFAHMCILQKNVVTIFGFWRITFRNHRENPNVSVCVRVCSAQS